MARRPGRRHRRRGAEDPKSDPALAPDKISKTTPCKGSRRSLASTACVTLHRLQRPLRPRWPFDADGVARPYVAVRYHDAHDAGLADQVAVGVPVQRRCHQAFAETVDLDAGVAQPGEFDDSTCPEMQPRSGWQCQQVDAFGGDVLSEVGGLKR